MRTPTSMPALLSEAQIAEIWNALGRLHGGEPMRASHLYFARRIEMAIRLQSNVRQLPTELLPIAASLASTPWEDGGQGPDRRIQIGPLDAS